MDKITAAMADMLEDELLALTDKYLADGKDPKAILDAYQAGMTEVGKRYEAGEYFVSELILAGEMMTAGSDKIKPFLKGDTSSGSTKGRVLIATVEGDIHDIGKNIAGTIMELAGYEVKNLGEDVKTSIIVEEVKNFKPKLLGLSGLLTLAYDPMKAVVDQLKEAGLRDGVKVLLGGSQIDEHILKYVGADVFANDAMTNVTYLNSLP
ncbi:MAG: cobalamin-dependent protein [Deltaproteobacteria bacterium]|jgi:5-methyltetrahydrofolate--homocysteine methyltransferase|nr:cobalamin-dependent protein [Deltaproteobacteria bacterium]